QRTVRVSQRLYEGIELPGEGNVGLIRYMRTDSVTLAAAAVDEIREVIRERYGDANVPETQPEYKNKSKNAQEAHEAIRPTSARRRSEEHTSELQSRENLVCRLLLEKKKKKNK